MALLANTTTFEPAGLSPARHPASPKRAAPALSGLAAPVFVLARSRAFRVRHARCVLDSHPPATPLGVAVLTRRTTTWN
jgi:hypothetical protein